MVSETPSTAEPSRVLKMESPICWNTSCLEFFERAVDDSNPAPNSSFASTFDSATRLVLSDRQVHRTENQREEILHGPNDQTRKELTVRSTRRHRAAALHLRVWTLEEQTVLRWLAQKNARRKSHRRLRLRRHRPR